MKASSKLFMVVAPVALLSVFFGVFWQSEDSNTRAAKKLIGQVPSQSQETDISKPLQLSQSAVVDASKDVNQVASVKSDFVPESKTVPSHILQQVSEQVDWIYEPLIEDMNIAGDDLFTFKNYLSQLMVINIERMMALRLKGGGAFHSADADGNINLVEAEDFNMDDLNQQADAINKSIQGLLSPKDLEKFDYYQNTAPERNYIGLLKERLQGDYPYFDKSIEEEMIKRIYDLRMSLPSFQQLSSFSPQPEATFSRQQSLEEQALYRTNLRHILKDYLEEDAITKVLGGS